MQALAAIKAIYYSLSQLQLLVVCLAREMYACHAQLTTVDAPPPKTAIRLCT